MRTSFQALCAPVVLGAAVAFGPACAYAAAPVIDTTGFSLQAKGEPPVAGIELVSEHHGYATFSMWGIGQAAHAAADSRGWPGLDSELEWESGYGLAVKDGYRITTITITGEFYGALRPAQWSTPGSAGNEVGILFKVDRPNHPPGWKVAYTSHLDGRQGFRFDVESAALTGDVGLSFAGYTTAWASSAWYEDGPGEDFWLGSYADAGIANLEMTIGVSPVPEPASCAMLLAGLGLLGMARRRR